VVNRLHPVEDRLDVSERASRLQVFLAGRIRQHGAHVLDRSPLRVVRDVFAVETRVDGSLQLFGTCAANLDG
jgi:hypothetical protein